MGIFVKQVKDYTKGVKSGALRGPLWLMPAEMQVGAAIFMWGNRAPGDAAAKLFWLFYQKGSAETWNACQTIIDKIGLKAFHDAIKPDEE